MPEINEVCWSCGAELKWSERPIGIVLTDYGVVCRLCVHGIVTAWLLNSNGQEPRQPVGKPPIVNGEVEKEQAGYFDRGSRRPPGIGDAGAPNDA